MTNYVLIGYCIGMIVFLVKSAEDARENKDNDPEVDLVTRHPAGPALMAVFAILMSPLWPMFALGAAARWLAARMRGWAVRLRAYAEEDDA